MSNRNHGPWGRRLCAFLPLFFALLAAACAKPAETPAAEPTANAQAPSQTIMIYMVGSDLESENGAASGDLEEIRLSGADTDRLHIVVLAGGSFQWQSDVSADANTTYHLVGERWEAIDRSEPRNMGEAQTLSDFLNNACAQYPADSYALILWDHGGGPVEGYGYDELHAFDHLTLPEMRQALQNSPFGKGKQRLSWIGFDACLMASIETADVFSDYADYMIASQEAIPNQGWNYRFLANAANGLSDGSQAARQIIDDYAAYYEAENAQLTNSRKTATLSCLDLSRAGAVEDALEALSSRLEQAVNTGDYSQIAKKRGDTRAFGRFTLGRNFDLIDLCELARQFSAEAPEESAALTEAVNEMVVCQRSNQELTGGVSIFFPFDNTEYLTAGPNAQFEWQEVYEQLGFAPKYAAFLYRFSQRKTDAPLQSWAESKPMAPVLDSQTGEYYFQLTPEQTKDFSKAAFYILGQINGGEYMMYFMSRDLTLDEGGRLHVNYDDKAIFIIDRDGNRILPRVWEDETVGGLGRYRVSMGLQDWDQDNFLETFQTQSAYLQLELNRNTSEVKVIGAIPIGGDEERPRGKQEIRIEDWKMVNFTSSGRYLTRGADGRILPFGYWESSEYYSGWELMSQDGFSVQYLPLDDIPYDLYCIVTVQDTQGNEYSSMLMPVAKKAEEPEPELEALERPVTVRFPYGGTRSVTVLDNDDMHMSLMGMECEEYMNTVKLTFAVENKTSDELDITMEDVCVGDCGISSSMSGVIAPSTVGLATLSIEVSSSAYDTSMQDAGLTAVRELSFMLSYERNMRDMPKRLVTVRTDFDPTLHYKPIDLVRRYPFPLEPQLLYQRNGVTLRLNEATVTTGVVPKLRLVTELENENANLGRIKIAHLSVNGVMADEAANGGWASGPFRVGSHRAFTLGVDIDELADIGITEVRELAFSIDVFDQGRNLMDREWYAFALPTPARLKMVSTQEPSALEADGARVIVDQNGVRITQLPGFAAGRFQPIFLVENNTGLLLELSSCDETLDGEPNSRVSFFSYEIAPGKRKYIEMALNLDDPAVLTPTSRIGMRMLAVDAQANELLFATDSIEFTF